MGLFDDLSNLVSGASTAASAAAPVATPAAAPAPAPTVVVVQQPAAPASPSVPTPAQAAPAAFSAAAATNSSASSILNNVLWIDPVSLSQWNGHLDVNGFFVKVTPITQPTTSESVVAGHAYQIGPIRSDGTFDVLSDLGARSVSGSASAIGTSTSTTENAIWVDQNGKPWAGYILPNGKFHTLEPAVYYQPKTGLVKGHAYRMGPAPTYQVGADLGIKTAGGFLSSLTSLFSSSSSTPATPSAPPPPENVLFVDVGPTTLPGGAQVYAWAGNFSGGVFNKVEPAAYMTVQGSPTTGMQQSPPGLTPGHYYQFGGPPGFNVGNDLGTTPPKTAGGPIDDMSNTTVALLGVGAVAVLGLIGVAAYRALEPKEVDSPFYGVLSSATKKDLVRRGQAHTNNVRHGIAQLCDDLDYFDEAIVHHRYAVAARAAEAASTHVTAPSTITTNLSLATQVARKLGGKKRKSVRA